MDQPPGEQSPTTQRSETTRQWVEACNNCRGGGGKVKNKVSKSNAAKQTHKTATQKVNSQLETLVSKHGRSQPQAARPPSPMNADRLSPPLPPPAYDVTQTKQHKVAHAQSRYHFYWNRSARSVCRERQKLAQQAAKQKKADQHRDLTADDLSDLDKPSSAKKVNVSVQNECFEGEDPTPIPQIVDKVRPTNRQKANRPERERDQESERDVRQSGEEKERSRSPARRLVIMRHVHRRVSPVSVCERVSVCKRESVIRAPIASPLTQNESQSQGQSLSSSEKSQAVVILPNSDNTESDSVATAPSVQLG